MKCQLQCQSQSQIEKIYQRLNFFEHYNVINVKNNQLYKMKNIYQNETNNDL